MLFEILGLIIIMLILYIFSSNYLVYEEEKKNYNFNIKNSLKINKENIFIGLQILFLGIFGFAMFVENDLDIFPFYKYLIVFTLLFDAVLIDIKKRIIPNLLCLIMLVVVVIINGYQIMDNLEAMKIYLISYLAGGVIAFIIFFLAKFISRNGVGGGDIKMMTIIGFCVGNSIFDVIFYIVFVSFVYSVFMLLFRKAKLHDSMAMAPFIYIGFLIYFVSNLI